MTEATTSEARLKERINRLQTAVDEEARKSNDGDGKSMWCSLEVIAAIAVPMLFLLYLLFFNPSFVQKTVNGEKSRDVTKMLYWTLGVTFVTWAVIAGIYFYRGGKLTYVC